MSSARTEEFGVIIVNYGSHELLAVNVGAMPEGVRVVVVDNFLSSAERHAVRDLSVERGWELVALPNNAGFGAAMNTGVRHAVELGCAAFLLLNPDAKVSADVVRELRTHVFREPMTMVSPRIADPEGTVVFQGVELVLADGRMRRAGRLPVSRQRPVQLWLTGACLAVHRELFDSIGGFDERYFLYWEDVDLSFRAARAGGRLVVRHDLIAHHDEGGTQGPRRGRAKSDIYYYYNCRNRLIFAAQNLPQREVVRWLVRTPAASWEILMRGGRRQLLHSPRPVFAAVRGTLAGALACVRMITVGRRPLHDRDRSGARAANARQRT